MTSHITDDVSIFYIQPTLNRLFNNSTRLYRGSSRNMKGSQPEKTTFKKPSIFRVNTLILFKLQTEGYGH